MTTMFSGATSWSLGFSPGYYIYDSAYDRFLVDGSEGGSQYAFLWSNYDDHDPTINILIRLDESVVEIFLKSNPNLLKSHLSVCGLYGAGLERHMACAVHNKYKRIMYQFCGRYQGGVNVIFRF